MIKIGLTNRAKPITHVAKTCKIVAGMVFNRGSDVVGYVGGRIAELLMKAFTEIRWA